MLNKIYLNLCCHIEEHDIKYSNPQLTGLTSRLQKSSNSGNKISNSKELFD